MAPNVDLAALQIAAQSHVASLGFFERVNTYEPKAKPGYGLTAAVWVDRIDPVAGGLASTSARVTFNCRIYARMMAEPQEMIDPNMLQATSAVLGSFTGDFDLGVVGVRAVDLEGIYGSALSGQAGYINQDGTLFRVMTLVLPVLVNDVWDQVA